MDLSDGQLTDRQVKKFSKSEYSEHKELSGIGKDSPQHFLSAYTLHRVFVSGF